MIIVEKKEYQIGVEKKQIIIEMSQRGPSGPRGLKGDTGEQGPQGEKGDPGTTTWEGITDKPHFGALADHDTVDYESEVTNKPVLGALADHDTIDYETELTNKPSLGTMASQDDAPADSEEYIRKNGAWAKTAKDATVWGSITGSLQNQMDLNIALSGKAESVHQHGYMASNGKITGGAVVVTNGDRMLISDASNNNSLVMSNVVFDGASTDKALTKKGSFESFVPPSVICDTETSMTATRDYTSGSLIIVGRVLYLTLTNIASGSALIVGSNVSETTLAEYIISLIS